MKKRLGHDGGILDRHRYTIGQRRRRTGHACSDEDSHGHNPFPMTGVSRDSGGVRHYDEFGATPATLLDMLAEQVDRRPDSGGGSRTRRRPADVSAAMGPRGAGRRRAACGRVDAGRPRRRAVPGGYQLGARVLGHGDGRRCGGGGQHALRATGGRVRAGRLWRAGGSGRRHAAARRPAVRDRATWPHGYRRAVLHVGHHRSPQGRADHP